VAIGGRVFEYKPERRGKNSHNPRPVFFEEKMKKRKREIKERETRLGVASAQQFSNQEGKKKEGASTCFWDPSKNEKCTSGHMLRIGEKPLAWREGEKDSKK